MGDFRMGFDVVGASYGSLPGVVVKLPPFSDDPAAPGTLRAAYVNGKKPGKFCPDPLGRVLMSRFDWSGRGQHIAKFGRSAIIKDYWFECAVSTSMPTTPFTANSLINGDPATGFTLVAFVQADVTAKSINLIRAIEGTSPNSKVAALILQPQNLGGRILASATNLTATSAADLNPLTNELGQVSMYAARFTTTERQSFAKAPGESVRSSSVDGTDVTLESAAQFLIGLESGSGPGINRILGYAFYRGQKSTGFLEDLVHPQFAGFHAAIGSGLAIT